MKNKFNSTNNTQEEKVKIAIHKAAHDKAYDDDEI